MNRDVLFSKRCKRRFMYLEWSCTAFLSEKKYIYIRQKINLSKLIHAQFRIALRMCGNTSTIKAEFFSFFFGKLLNDI